MHVHAPALWLAFQVHYSPIGCNDCSVIRAQWAAMEKLLAENKTRTIGVSNFCRHCLECLSSATVQPAVNQFEYVSAPSCDPNAYATSARPNALSCSLSMPQYQLHFLPLPVSVCFAEHHTIADQYFARFFIVQFLFAQVYILGLHYSVHVKLCKQAKTRTF
jgi:hypothetical protein